MTDLLVPLLVLEGVLVALVVLATLLHAGGRAARERWLRPRVESASRAIVAAIAPAAAPETSALALAELDRLPRRERLVLLAGVGERLTGAAGRRVTDLLTASGLEHRLEASTRARRRGARLRAARVLTAAGGGAGVMPGLLEDPDPWVRAQAALWVVRHGDDDAIDLLIRHTTEHEGLMRFAAADAAVRTGARAVPALDDLLRRGRGEDLAAPLRVAGRIGDLRVLDAVRAHLLAPESAVRAEAVHALARLGGVAEADALEAALSDEDAAVRAAAAEGLGRVGAWRAAPRLGAALRDPAWDVRRAAGLALLDLEAPGALVLRRALADEDRFAVDMARRALDEERVA